MLHKCVLLRPRIREGKAYSPHIYALFFHFFADKKEEEKGLFSPLIFFVFLFLTSLNTIVTNDAGLYCNTKKSVT